MLPQAVKIHLKSRLDISDAEAVEFVSQLDLDGDGKGWSANRFGINRPVCSAGTVTALRTMAHLFCDSQ